MKLFFTGKLNMCVCFLLIAALATPLFACSTRLPGTDDPSDAAPASASAAFSEVFSEEESANASEPVSEESIAEISAEYSETPSEEIPEISEVPSEEIPEISEAPSEPETSAPEETSSSYTLRISELMASSSLYRDANGVPCDWAELFNYGNTAVLLDGAFFTDDPVSGKRHVLSGSLPAGEYMVSYFADEYGLSLSKGETLYLCAPNGKAISALVIPEELKKDVSYAYGGIRNAGAADGTDLYGCVVTTLCTPGFSNDEAGLEAYLAEREKTTGALVIYELMAANSEYYEQKDKYYDWVELKNASSTTIDLSEYFLSDDPDDPCQWSFPQKKLAPGETFTVFCSGDTGLTTSKYVHVPFKLSASADRLFVTASDGTLSDSVYIADITYLGSMGRLDGKNGFFYFTTPTPGKTNTEGFRYIAHAPAASVDPGLYPEGSSLTVSLEGEGVIRYTTDGSEPNASSAVYAAPFRLESNAVIRAVSFAEGKAPSAVTTAEYIFCKGHTLPVVCISADPDDFFSEERGIWYGEYSDRNANFRQDWERKVHFSLYDTNGETVFADCGVKLTGQGSRKLPKKSMQLKFRSRYGFDELEYDIFGDGSFTVFNTLKLRVGEDYPLAIFRDELITSLASETSVTVQKYRYCVLYLNGEYYGIYAFRNKIDEEFISQLEGCDEDEVIIVNYDGSAEVGPKKPFKNTFSFVTGNDMSVAANYEAACEMIDMQSLCDWIAIQAFTGNTDLGNDRAYRAADGKWKWILYDTDWGFSTNHKAYYLFDYNRSTAKLARALFKNKDFLDLYLTRLAYIMDNVFSPARVNERCALLTAILEPEAAANAARWGFSVKSWKKNIEKINNYVSSRRAEVCEQTKARFGLSGSDMKKYFGD